MNLTRRRNWSRDPATCCQCGTELLVKRFDDAVAIDAGFMPNVPGAVCADCLALVDGLVVDDVRDDAADTILRTAHFEENTPDAVQAFLDVFGWAKPVIAGAGMRLHLDGFTADAYELFDAAAAAKPNHKKWFQVEKCGLLILDGETGQALDILNATGESDHPCWNLHHGLLAQSVGRGEAAAEHWRRQIEIEPEEPLGWKMLGWYLMQETDDYTGAEALFREACELFPKWMEFRAWLGNALYRQGRIDEAIKELESSRFLDPIDEEFGEQVQELLEQLRGEQREQD